jgi:hypothetical protein
VAVILGAPPLLADTPRLVWTWSFTPPSVVNNNVAAVLGGPDLDGDGYADALVACEDYTVRALSGHATGTAPLIWTFGGTDERPDSDRALALFPDRTGDDIPEVVFGTGANDRSIHLLNGADGTQIWEYDIRDTGCTLLAPVYLALPVGDLNGDGIADVAAAVGGPCNRVLALDGAASGTGVLLWEHLAGDGFWAVAPAGDLSGDGVPDVLAGSGTNSLDNRAMLLDGPPSAPDGREVWTFTAGNMVADLTTIGDITDDKVDDVVLGSWDRWVRAVDGASKGDVEQTLWEHQISGGPLPYVTRTARVPDLNGDCTDDVVIGSFADNFRVLSGLTGAVLWGPESLGTDQVPRVSGIPDVTGDLQWDVIVGTWNPGRVAVYDGVTGANLWIWSAPDNVTSVDFIGDIDDDGLPDVLVGGQDVATVYALAGRNVVDCVRPGTEAQDVRATRLDIDRIRLTWDTSADPCHARYAVFGIPADADGCFARIKNITDQDEDGDPTNTTWTGDAPWFGYVVISVSADGGQGPLGHFRR